MLRIASSIIISVLLVIQVDLGQSKAIGESDKQGFPDFIPLVVSEGNQPLRIEAASLEVDAEGEINPYYTVKNVSGKRIKSYSVVLWFGDNTGSYGSGAMPKNGILSPGATVSNRSASRPLKQVGKIKGKSDTGSEVCLKQTKHLAFFLIREVAFEDGSTFNADGIFNSLERHLALFEPAYSKIIDSCILNKPPSKERVSLP